jgi:hypothetical protein
MTHYTSFRLSFTTLDLELPEGPDQGVFGGGLLPRSFKR